jgi:multisubunit Na+/H+ antiporter MnhB subunit
MKQMAHSIIFLFGLIIGPRLVIEGLRRVFDFSEVKKVRSFTTWHLVAILMAAFGVAISHVFRDPVVANFVQHAIGGGVTSFCLVMYGIEQLKLKLKAIQLLLLVIAVVCVLGVANELMEYALELTTSSIFSWDTHDTWRDLAANTTGGLIGWSVYSAIRRN